MPTARAHVPCRTNLTNPVSPRGALPSLVISTKSPTASCNSGPQNLCTLPFGTSITFKFTSFYTVEPDDYTLTGHKLTDTLSVVWQDLCDGGSGNCSEGTNNINTATGSTTVEQYTPSVTTALTPPSPVAVGTSVTDQATISGASPTAGGTVSYAVYSNNTCSTLVQSLGTLTVTSGSVGASNPWTATPAGNYWFQATYSGDTANAGPVSSACTSEPMVVSPNTPTVTTALTPPSPVLVGTSVTDQATITGATATAGGTVSYAVYSNNTCSTLVASLGSKTVTSGSVGASNSWTSVVGSYWFQATYSGDTSNTGPVSSACTSEPMVVNPYTPSVTTALTPPSPVAVGTSVTDQATLSGASPTAGGTVSYAVYSNNTCSTLVQSLGTKTVSGATVGASNPWTSVVGSYWFQATYSGDTNNTGPVSSACTSEPMVVNPKTPSVTTALSPSSPVLAGTSVSDQATITGATATAGGTVTYAVYSDNTCSTLVASLGTKTVSGATVGASNAWTSVVGNYWFQATYSGDTSNTGPVSSACSSEPMVVELPGISITKMPATQTILAGGTATWTIVVKNTGSVPLTNVTVADPIAPLCDDTFPGTLAPGDSETGYSCSLTGQTADFTNKATATGTPPIGPDVTDTASATVTVFFSPTVTTALTPPSPVLVGTSVTDQATISGAGPTAGGTVSYAVYSNNTCSTLVASLGTLTVTNGSVGASNPWTATPSGNYWFQATYSGDVNNTGPVSSACTSEPMVVNKYTPSVTTALTPPSPVAVGTSVTDQATISGASPTAGGTVAYAVYSNSTCSTLVQSLGTKTVSGATVGASNAWTATPAGNYWFQATYSGDTANTGPVSSACTSEPMVVSPNTPTVTTALTPPSPVLVGTSVTDQATITGATATAGGTVSYAVYSNNTCSTLVASLGTKTVTSGSVGASNSWTSVVGNYWFQATYSGDTSNTGPVSSACTSEPMVVNKYTPSVTTALTPPSPVAVGTSVTDQATISGASPTAGGTVSYAVYSNNTCSTLVQSLGTLTVTSGSVGASNPWTATPAGNYWFQATYSGDTANAGPVSSACTSEPMVVSPNTPSVTTALTPPSPVLVGTSVTDQATITGATATAGGTVSYAVYSNNTCSTLVASLGSKTVTSGSVGASNPWTATPSGNYWFQATYSGDTSNTGPVSSACTSEPMVVNPYTPSVTTALTPPSPVSVGTSVTDQATLSGASPTAGGTVSYAVYSDSLCSTLVDSLGTKTVTSGSVGASNPWTATPAGNYWFQATYSGDVNNTGPVSSACTSEPMVVENPPSIAITKLPATQTVPSGGTATWTIVVTNNGAVPLTSVSVADPLSTGCVMSFTGTLAPGDSETAYTCSQTGITVGFTNVATASGTPPVGPPVMDSASAKVTVVASKISTTLTDFASATTVVSGTSVTFTYTETNTGNTPIVGSSVTVTGSVCGAATFTNSSDGITATFDPGAVWTFTCTITLTNLTNAPVTVVDHATATGINMLTGKPAPLEHARERVKITPAPCGIGVSVSPNPVMETGASEINAVVQVEACLTFAGRTVNIDSQQLVNACATVTFASLQPGATPGSSIKVILDNDGNATVSLTGTDCSSGMDLIETDLVKAPYLTTTTTLTVLPPGQTPPGMTGFPPNEVETGDSTATGISDVYSVFQVEADPVYAGSTVQISSIQLFNSCLGGVTWTTNMGTFTGATATATLDDDGNAVFAFTGKQCAATTSLVTAVVEAGTFPNYQTMYTVLPPSPRPRRPSLGPVGSAV